MCKMRPVPILKKYLLIFAVFCGFAEGASHCRAVWLSEPEWAKTLFDKHYKRIKDSGIEADIDLSELTIFPSPEEGEHSDVSLKTGRLRGEEIMLKTGRLEWKAVILKPIGRNNTDDRHRRGKRELAVQLVLRELKAPVLFEGVFQDESEEFFIVSRFQEGDLWHLDRSHEWRWKNSCRSITNRTYQDLSALKKLFLRYHIMPWDMQVIVSSKTGAIYMIDVEYYEFVGGRAREAISLAEFRTVDIDNMRKHAKLVKEVFGPEWEYSMEKNIKNLQTRRGTRREFIKSDWSDQFNLPGAFRQKAKFFCANPLAAFRLF